MNIQQFLEEEDDFTPLTMEEDLDNMADSLDIGGNYCCDGRECGCNGETRLSVLKRFINEYISKERNKVLDEVKNSLEKELEKWDESAEELEDGWGNYTVCLPWELKEKKVDISTIIDQLKLK